MWSGFLGVLVDAINLVIKYFGSAMQHAIDVLPEMPEIPAPPTQLTDVEGWVSWVFPLAEMKLMVAFTSSMYFVWWVASIVLRWAKAERGNA